MITENTTDTTTETDFNPDSFLTVYFFRSKTWYGYIISALQWLIGSPWQSPNHVAIGYKDKLIELTTEGLDISEDTGAAYRLSTNVFRIQLNAAQAQDLLALVVSFQALNIYFSLPETVAFVWRVLWHTNRHFVYNRECDYGEIAEIISGRTAFFCPPLSCTTLVWQPLDDATVALDWRIFAPAFLEFYLDSLNKE